MFAHPSRRGRHTPGDRAPVAPLRDGGDVHDLVDVTRHSLLLMPDLKGRPLPTDAARRARQIGLDTRLPLRIEALTPADHETLRRYGATQPTAILLRPDGHIAWRGPAQALHHLKTHLLTTLVTPPRHPGATGQTPPRRKSANQQAPPLG